MIKVNENDYVICKNPESPKKNFLMQVVKVGDSKIGGYIEHDRHLKEEKVTVPKLLVVANLGEDPTPGKYGNVDARDIYRKTFHHDEWGDIHFFVKPSKPLRKALKKSLDTTAARLEKRGLSSLFRNVCNEIRSPRGKYAGMYKHGGKNKPNRLQLFLKEEHAQHMDYVLYHESGHVVRYNFMKNSGLRARWLKLYNISVPKVPIKGKEFESMFKQLEKAQPEDLKEYASSLEEDEEKKVLKTVVRYMKQVHRVTPRDIDVLIHAGKYEQLYDLWPTRTIDVNELEPLVSEYATKNVEELFAEAFAFHMVKKKLPKSVGSLLENSLSYASEVAKKKSQE